MPDSIQGGNNMGQLERYGLYVLCLVIFLILGVAIWGSDPQGLRSGYTLSTVGGEADVKTPDSYRSDVRDYAKAQVKKSVTKHVAAQETMFERAPAPVVDPGMAAVDSIVASAPIVEIQRADKPVTVTEVKYHTIADGDNFSSLARHYLKDANLYYRIEAANPKLDPMHLTIGTRIVIPERTKGAAGARKSSSVVAGKTHKVMKGDSPWRIAEKYVGAGKAHAYSQRIIKLNGITNSKQLTPGDIIKLPSR
jgi:nucleoid-associated protein YgaU